MCNFQRRLPTMAFRSLAVCAAKDHQPVGGSAVGSIVKSACLTADGASTHVTNASPMRGDFPAKSSSTKSRETSPSESAGFEKQRTLYGKDHAPHRDSINDHRWA